MTHNPEFQGIAECKGMRSLLDQARRFAAVARPVLIRGERGTGKELVARFIHACSPRSARPWVAINCAAFNDELVASQLFGHERGAFTGAVDRHRGKLEQADGGTLFLDEIGSMSAGFQDRILRVVEYQEFERLGGSRPIKVDVRVISATNAHLEELMQEHLFRSDLYDRLTFAELKVPPLRHRREDVPHLIVFFVKRLQEEMPNLLERRFLRSTVDAMMEYYWPGNVRELKNVVERVYLWGTEDTISPSQLPPEIMGQAMTGGSFHERVERFKARLIMEAMEACHDNQREAAEHLEMTYDQFRHHFKKYRTVT